jgi:NAD(P)-dependent dehydrogenase (short-subunit alcohol dehydrogenase family)
LIQVQQRAKTWNTELQYRRVDVRDTGILNAVIEDIANHERRMDGLIAAAAIQQETSALEYSAEDSNALLEVNVTGVFMTAQAVARQMVRFGNGGSIVLVASMSGTVVNRVSLFYFFFLWFLFPYTPFNVPTGNLYQPLYISTNQDSGINLPSLQRKQSSCHSTSPQSCRRMGPV